MSWYRKNPLFATVLTLCGLLALGELALTYERFTAARAAEKKLRDLIATTTNFAGVTGNITLDENRNATKPAVVLEIKGGKKDYSTTIAP